MGAGHSHALYVHEHTPLHRMAPEAKIVGSLVLVACIALTPRQAIWAFAVYAAVIAGLVVIAKISPGFLFLRLLAVAPFVLFALFIPFIAGGGRIVIWGIAMSVDGLWGTWNILAKALLGASVSIVLTATTEIPDILRGTGVLRVPALFTSIAMFMIRYLELIADELGRMRVAMASRGYEPRWLHQARPVASSAGALFVRSYERGERVHSAMLARGFTGTMPTLGHRRAGPAEWLSVASLLALCLTVVVTAMVAT